MRWIFASVLLLFFAGCENKKLYESGNTEQKPLELQHGKMIDPHCKMFVNAKKHSAQAVMKDGRTYFFDDVGCLVLWGEEQKEKDIKHFVYTLDTHEYVEAQGAFYSRTDETPMHYGFGAYKNKKDGLVDFKTARELILRGEDMTNPAIRRMLLGK